MKEWIRDMNNGTRDLDFIYIKEDGYMKLSSKEEIVSNLYRLKVDLVISKADSNLEEGITINLLDLGNDILDIRCHMYMSGYIDPLIYRNISSSFLLDRNICSLFNEVRFRRNTGNKFIDFSAEGDFDTTRNFIKKLSSFLNLVVPEKTNL